MIYFTISHVVSHYNILSIYMFFSILLYYTSLCCFILYGISISCFSFSIIVNDIKLLYNIHVNLVYNMFSIFLIFYVIQIYATICIFYMQSATPLKRFRSISNCH